MAAVQRRLALPPAPPQLRHGNPGTSRDATAPVCRYWKSGHCSRNPCRFLHADPTAPIAAKKRNNTWVNTSSRIASPSPTTTSAAVPPVPPPTERHAEQVPPPPKRQAEQDEHAPPPPKRQAEQDEQVPPPPKRQAEQDEHAPPPPKRGCHPQQQQQQQQQEGPREGAWCAGDGICGVARLEGAHAKAVTGLAVPEGSGTLFSGSLDGTVRAWDCATGKCVHLAPVHEGEVGRLIAMGQWVLAGVRGAVRALHTGNGKELQLRLPTPGAQITALLAEDDERVFAGAEDGAIYIWRLNREHQRFDEVAALTAHDGHAVASLAQGKGALYSGSTDGSVRVWDLETHRCICSFPGHASKVTALLCWDRFLLSSSDDGTVKVWRSKPDEDDLELEVHYTHREEGQRVVAMDGTHDADKKPVLLVARGDGLVHVYDLPSFKIRGQIRCDGKVTAMSLRTPGMIFTGDESGEIRVAKWTPATAAQAQA